MSLPQVRANWAKFTVRCAKRAPEPLRSALLAAIPAELRAEIRATGPLEWLPAQVFVELCEAIRRGAGTDGARGFWRQSLRDAIRQPFIQPLARGALFLWGKTPSALVRRTPQAWQLVSRHCGELKAVESGDESSITLRVEQLPAICRRQGLLVMWEGGLSSPARRGGHGRHRDGASRAVRHARYRRVPGALGSHALGRLARLHGERIARSL